MMKKLLIILALFGYKGLIHAQDSIYKSKQKIKFQSFEQVGLLAGESKSAFHVETINGIRYNSFFGGIGVGIDNYKFRTIPLFIDIRKDVLNKPNTPFVFTDAGWQFAWVEDIQKMALYGINAKYNGNFYFNAGAGYTLNLNHSLALTISGAFELKKINELSSSKINAFVDCYMGPCPEIINKYSLKPFSITTAITFW